MVALGMSLLVLGAVIAVAEAHYPAHGIAGGLGVMAMAAGAVLAISGLGAGLLLGLLAGAALAGSGFGLLTLSLTRGVAVKRMRVRTGAEGIVGRIGLVRSWADTSGRVALDGALWRARGSAEDEQDLRAGDSVVVERLTGLTLSVRKAEDWELL
jgi:membrane-bound ClpP family serine protease